MSKKHFEALAAALKATQPPLVSKVVYGQFAGAQDAWLDTVNGVADVCARFNSNFDRARFLAACGVEA